jgi:hypothetical protein
MRWTNRSFLAIAISSLLFGGIAVPYIYLALVWHTDPLRIVTWLAPCTIFLGLILVSRSWIEEKLAHQWGFFFRFLIVTLTIGAFIYSFFFTWALSSITIFVPPLVDWFYLIVNSGIATLIAFVIIIAARPSRLEKIIAAKVSGYGISPLLYRRMRITQPHRPYLAHTACTFVHRLRIHRGPAAAFERAIASRSSGGWPPARQGGSLQTA